MVPMEATVPEYCFGHHLAGRDQCAREKDADACSDLTPNNGLRYIRAARRAPGSRGRALVSNARPPRSPYHFAVTAIFTDGWILQRTVKAPDLSNV
jgi:hypothetical protein